MITESSSAWSFVATLSALRTAFMSCGFTMEAFFTPSACTSPSKSSSRLSRFCSVTPLNGLPWRPVMAVVRLSKMHTVPHPWLYTVVMSDERPECPNVESPMTATTGLWSVPASANSKPCDMETDAPMSTHVSMAERGGSAPRV